MDDLAALGVSRPADVVARYGVEAVEGALDRLIDAGGLRDSWGHWLGWSVGAMAARGIRNPAGLLLSWLRAGPELSPDDLLVATVGGNFGVLGDVGGGMAGDGG